MSHFVLRKYFYSLVRRTCERGRRDLRQFIVPRARGIYSPCEAARSKQRAMNDISQSFLAEPLERRLPTHAEIFMGFLTLGLSGFGGVLPLARRMIVEERQWLSPAEFTDLLGLCQFLPGGNILNMSIAVGMKFRGVPGAALALTGLLAAPAIIVVLLGLVYDRFIGDPAVRHLFAGLGAAAAGLLIALAVKIAMPIIRKPIPVVIAALCFALIAFFRTPLLPTLVLLVPISILAQRWGRQ